MQSKGTAQNRITNKITNPAFLNKTPPNNSIKSSQIHNTSSINTLSSKTILQKVRSARLSSIINLSNMNLEILPPEIFDENLKFNDLDWWQMVDIKKIDASNNKLNSDNPDSDFSILPSLNYLKFSFNNFSWIPISIFQLKNLKYLDFSNNKLVHLHKEIGTLFSLVDLNLSNNLLLEIPREIQNLKELEILNLSNNKLQEIPNNFIKLKRLDLSENLIKGEFNILANNLEELILFKNKINAIDLSNLENLVYLDIHNNFLSEFEKIPNSNKFDTIVLGFNKLVKICNLKNAPKISVLDLNNNKLENLSEEIFYLKELKTLNLMNNSINDLPPQLCFLKNLVRINLEGNPLKKLNSRVRSSNAENIKTYLRSRLTDEDMKKLNEDLLKEEFLDTNYNSNKNNISLASCIQNNSLKMNNLEISEIPFEQFRKFLNIKFLVSLDFSDNKITNLEGFRDLVINNQFTELKEIKFSSNLISDIPEFFLNFNNLRIIDLKGNNLSTFFDFNNETFGEMMQEYKIMKIFPNLNYLDLSINKLKKIPGIVRNLKNLSILLLANNSITDTNDLNFNNDQNFASPYESQLDTLDLGNNKIEKLGDKMYKFMPNLKTLNLENNAIKVIPTDLCLLQNLNKLNLNGNPIKMLRSNILLGGTKIILEYLQKMHKFDEEDIAHQQRVKNRVQDNSTWNSNKESNKSNNFNSNKQSENMLVDDSNEIEKINIEILEVESELLGNLPIYKRTELRKKLNALIRFRANLMK